MRALGALSTTSMTSSSALPPPTGRYIPPGARGRVTTGARGTHFRTEAGLQVHPLLGAWGDGDGAAGSWGAYFPFPPACGFLALPLLGHGTCLVGT